MMRARRRLLAILAVLALCGWRWQQQQQRTANGTGPPQAVRLQPSHDYQMISYPEQHQADGSPSGPVHVVFTTAHGGRNDSVRRATIENVKHAWRHGMHGLPADVLRRPTHARVRFMLLDDDSPDPVIRSVWGVGPDELYHSFADEDGKARTRLPVVSQLYQAAIAMHPDAATFTFFNGDVVTDLAKFVATADALVALRQPFLAVGRRRDYAPWRAEYTPGAWDFDAFYKAAKPNSLSALDYFLTSRDVWDWGGRQERVRRVDDASGRLFSVSMLKIPVFVVGRIGYDSWLLDHAYHDPRVLVVDATAAIPLLHQNPPEDVDGRAGHHATAYKWHNMDLMQDHATKFGLAADHLAVSTDFATHVAAVESAAAASSSGGAVVVRVSINRNPLVSSWSGGRCDPQSAFVSEADEAGGLLQPAFKALDARELMEWVCPGAEHGCPGVQDSDTVANACCRACDSEQLCAAWSYIPWDGVCLHAISKQPFFRMDELIGGGSGRMGCTDDFAMIAAKWCRWVGPVQDFHTLIAVLAVRTSDANAAFHVQEREKQNGIRHGATVASSPVCSAEFLRVCGNSTADAATCDACTGKHQSSLWAAGCSAADARGLCVTAVSGSPRADK
jgi:hypothetical protein